jgi:phosphoribosylformylglycinamidine synthase
MVLAVIPERLERAREILDRHRVRNAVVGRFTDTAAYTVVDLPDMTEDAVAAAEPAELPDDHGTGFSVPYELLDYRPPSRSVPPPPQPELETVAWPEVGEGDLQALLAKIVADPEVACQRWASAQYDTTVQGRTLYGPDAGPHHVPTSFWAGAPLVDGPAVATFAVAFNPWLFEAHPVLATRQMFLSVLGAQALAGVSVQDVALCDNFYTPHLDPDGFAWLAAMVDELCELVREFRTPLISGKDSSAGSVVTPEGIVSVPPAVFLSSLGKLPDSAGLRRNEWTSPGSALVLIGPATPSPAGTVAGRLLDLPCAQVDALPPAEYHRYLEQLQGLPRGVVLSARPVGAGGTLGCTALTSMASGLACELTAPDEGWAALLQEHRCGALAEVPPDAVDQLPDGLSARVVGRVLDAGVGVRVGGRELLTDEAVAGWRDSWAERLR